MILMNTKKTRGEEIDWLADNLKKVEKGKIIMIVAEVDGHMVGIVEVRPHLGKMSHVGSLGISIKKGYRDIGIGFDYQAGRGCFGGGDIEPLLQSVHRQWDISVLEKYQIFLSDRDHQIGGLKVLSQYRLRQIHLYARV